VDFKLKGRVAIVTGASAGIGRGIAKCLAAEGAQTVIVARRLEKLQSLQAEIVADGGLKPMIVTADLYDRAIPAKIRDQVIAAFGRADIVVNDAGGSRVAGLDAPDEIWDESLAINFTAIRKVTHAFLPDMQANKWGRVINITGSMEPREFNAANFAKAGVHAWAKGLSRAVAKDGITINSLQPGRIHSEQTDNPKHRRHPTPELQDAYSKEFIPIGYFGDPEDVGHLATFLCSQQARYITGQRIYVDGGMHLAI
jgi:3-oxoacyl-[acyl-carrier protein] reductase